MSTYQKLSIHEKRAHDLRAVRETAVTCPSCDTQVMPVDLIAHMEQRCKGPSEPGPSARWMTWREAVAIIRRVMPELRLSEPAAMMRLSRWSHADRRGLVVVRARGTRGDRKYLHADLVKHLSRSGFVVGTNKTVSEEPCP
jgi:hypothetical protein